MILERGGLGQDVVQFVGQKRLTQEEPKTAGLYPFHGVNAIIGREGNQSRIRLNSVQGLGQFIPVQFGHVQVQQHGPVRHGAGRFEGFEGRMKGRYPPPGLGNQVRQNLCIERVVVHGQEQVIGS